MKLKKNNFNVCISFPAILMISFFHLEIILKGWGWGWGWGKGWSPFWVWDARGGHWLGEHLPVVRRHRSGGTGPPVLHVCLTASRNRFVRNNACLGSAGEPRPQRMVPPCGSTVCSFPPAWLLPPPRGPRPQPAGRQTWVGAEGASWLIGANKLLPPNLSSTALRRAENNASFALCILVK